METTQVKGKRGRLYLTDLDSGEQIAIGEVRDWTFQLQHTYEIKAEPTTPVYGPTRRAYRSVNVSGEVDDDCQIEATQTRPKT